MGVFEAIRRLLREPENSPKQVNNVQNNTLKAAYKSQDNLQKPDHVYLTTSFFTPLSYSGVYRALEERCVLRCREHP